MAAVLSDVISPDSSVSSPLLLGVVANDMILIIETMLPLRFWKINKQFGCLHLTMYKMLSSDKSFQN